MPDPSLRDPSGSAPRSSPGARGLRYWSPWLVAFAAGWLVAFGLAVPDPGAALRNHGALVAIGFLGAILGNATAIGGGLVFVPFMLLVFRLPPLEALVLALAGQAFGMTSGAIAWAQRRAIPRAFLASTLVPTLLGAALAASWLRPSPGLVKGLFGPVSIAIGMVVLLMLDRHGEGTDLPPRAVPGLAAASFVGGVLTGWVAIGVGELVAAWLMLRWHRRPELAIGLGVLLLSVSSLLLTAVHAAAGMVAWDAALLLGLGCTFGARLGPWLVQWISPRRLKLGFATIAIVDGILIVVQSLAG